jgi:hypothetical protein
LSDADLKDRCAYWQRLLRLQDWRIDVKFVDTENLADDALGSCSPFSDAKLAIIKLAREEATGKTGAFATSFPEHYDTERLLIHELLHIPLHGVITEDASEPERVLQEQAIESIADALIALERKNPSEEK